MRLSPTGYPWFYKVPHHIFINQSGISLRMSQHVRTGTNYRHFTLKDINKLRKFINIRTTEKVPKTSFSGIISRSLFTVGFIIHFHRTEFVTYKIHTIQPRTHLLKEYRTGRGQLYNTSNYEVNKGKNCN